MLAMTGDLDAVVTLEILDWEGHALAYLEVAQFDVAFEADRYHSRVVLPQSGLGTAQRLVGKTASRSRYCRCGILRQSQPTSALTGLTSPGRFPTDSHQALVGAWI